MNRFFLLLACLMALPFAPAYAQIRDSYYFMADDGKQSPEEMELEADYVFKTCANNTYQSRYFDCECVAGAFLQKREKYGAVAPQEELLQQIMRSKEAQCANPVTIAGDAYSECQNYVRVAREYRKDNEEFCSCVGNTVAKRFTKAPYLRTAYIRKLRTDALVLCARRDANGNPLPAQN